MVASTCRGRDLRKEKWDMLYECRIHNRGGSVCMGYKTKNKQWVGYKSERRKRVSESGEIVHKE